MSAAQAGGRHVPNQGQAETQPHGNDVLVVVEGEQPVARLHHQPPPGVVVTDALQPRVLGVGLWRKGGGELGGRSDMQHLGQCVL